MKKPKWLDSTKFFHWHVHSVFSMRDGLLSVDDLVGESKKYGQNVVALTDHGSLGGVWQFYEKATKAGLNPIIGCLLKGQNLITSDGTNTIENIEVGNLVFTHMGRFRRVNRTMCRWYSGFLYKIFLAGERNKFLALTEEHPILIKELKKKADWKKPGEITFGRPTKECGIKRWNSYVCLPKLENNIVNKLDVCEFLPKNFMFYSVDGVGYVKKIKLNKYESDYRWTINRKIILDSVFMRFLGLYVAEGSVAHNFKKQKLSGTILFTFNLDEKELADFVVEALKIKFNVSATKKERPEKNTLDVYCCNVPLAYILMGLCGDGAKNKKVPFFVFSCSKENCLSFIDGVLEGDGHKGNDGNLHISSEKLAWGMKALLPSFGYWVNVRKTTGKNGRVGYIVPFRRNRKYVRHVEDDAYLYKPINRIEKEWYEGFVYNVSVEDDESYVSDFVLHNCELYVSPTRDEIFKWRDLFSERFSIDDPEAPRDTVRRALARSYHLVVLAHNEQGYKNLLKIHNEAWKNGFYRWPRTTKEMLAQNSEGLIASTACYSGEIPQLLASGNFGAAKRALHEYQEIFGADNFFMEIMLVDFKPMLNLTPLLVELAEVMKVPMVVTCDAHYLRKDQSQLHYWVLNVNATKTFANESEIADERKRTWEMDAKDLYLKSLDDIWDFWNQHFLGKVPIKLLQQSLENIDRVRKMADRFYLEHEPRLPSIPNVYEELHRMSTEGFQEKLRLGIIPKDQLSTYLDRMAFEIGVIKQMRAADYMLIFADVAKFCREKDIVMGPGRGSAAGSLVSWLLGITGLDPIAHGLLFERFLNVDRLPSLRLDLKA